MSSLTDSGGKISPHSQLLLKSLEMCHVTMVRADGYQRLTYELEAAFYIRLLIDPQTLSPR